MQSTVYQVWLALCLGVCLAYGQDSNGTSTTTAPTSTTASPRRSDLSGSETHSNYAIALRPGESASRSTSQSFSKSLPADFEHRSYPKGRYAEQSPEGLGQHESYKGSAVDNHQYDRSKEQLHYSQAQDYGQRFEGGYGQRNHGGGNYQESHDKRNAYQFADQAIKIQEPYRHQEYAKGSLESSSKEDSYGDAKPHYLRYAYEVSNAPQKGGYAPAHEPENDGKSGYGYEGAKDYSSDGHEPEYHPVPHPAKYATQDSYKGSDYKSDDQKGGAYFQFVPKEAGYASHDQKEPEYLQSPPSQHALFKQAGYLQKSQEPAAYLSPQPKNKPDAGKLAVFIKHIGHKSGAPNAYVNKERQGYLLLPIVPAKMEEKLRELSEKYKEEHEQDYKDDKESSSYHSSHEDGKDYHYQKAVDYQPTSPRSPSVHYGHTYSQDQDHARPQTKKNPLVLERSHGSFKPILTHTTYSSNAHYPSPKAAVYPTGKSSDEGAKVYVPKSYSGYDSKVVDYDTKSAPDYEEEPEVKPYSAGHVVYGGSHPAIPSYGGGIKYEQPAYVYGKSRGYVSPYEVTTSPKSIPVKITGLRPTTYATLSHGAGYAGDADISSGRKASLTSSHLYGSHYRSTGIPLATAYGSPRYQVSHKAEKPATLILPRTKGDEVSPLHSSGYTSKGRVSAKELIDDFGLHHYESLLSKSRHGTGGGSLYYDLHSFPVRHTYAQYGLRKSGLKYYAS